MFCNLTLTGPLFDWVVHTLIGFSSSMRHNLFVVRLSFWVVLDTSLSLGKIDNILSTQEEDKQPSIRNKYVVGQ